MARKTETQKLQEYADEIWGQDNCTVLFSSGGGFFLQDDTNEPWRLIGRNANEAHAELDAMADIAKSQTVYTNG